MIIFRIKVTVKWVDGDKEEFLFESKEAAGAFIKGFYHGANSFAGDGYEITTEELKQ